MSAARVTQGALWLLAAALLALTARPFLDWSPAGEPGPAAPASPAARAPALADLELPPIESFAETLNRPLFTATRRPPSPLETIQGQAAPAKTAAKGEKVILGKYVLRGVVVTPAEKLLLLRQTATGQTLRLREGDALEDWRVASITPEVLVLSRGGAEQKVPLRGGD
jgi:general secretion pathway protein N